MHKISPRMATLHTRALADLEDASSSSSAAHRSLGECIGTSALRAYVNHQHTSVAPLRSAYENGRVRQTERAPGVNWSINWGGLNRFKCAHITLFTFICSHQN